MDYQGPTQGERLEKTQGTAISQYHHDLLGIHSETTGLTTRHYIRDNEGQVLGYEEGTTRHFFVKDHLGSVIDVVKGPDAVNRYTYEPYGEIYWQKDKTFDNPWRFAQGYFDSDISRYKGLSDGNRGA